MSILDISPVIPVVTLEDAAAAVPLARKLIARGIGIVELTLRTAAALDCIERIAGEVPEITIGAGTVTRAADIEAAVKAGAQFLVSPGTTADLARALRESGLPALPGCSTISEALTLRDLGFTELKFFPAEASGGPGWLSAVYGPLPDLRFCPTGGITEERAPAYLALPNVPCVGGSWLSSL
jgi:2-dehydro-3-deoxyphosphogluconate aldolase/(4S)-4-hydroxy-2-oxoglutarate aldolase